jgi:hypothetical protein
MKDWRNTAIGALIGGLITVMVVYMGTASTMVTESEIKDFVTREQVELINHSMNDTLAELLRQNNEDVRELTVDVKELIKEMVRIGTLLDNHLEHFKNIERPG